MDTSRRREPLPLLGNRQLAVAGIASATVYAVWRASVDLDPGSLWKDDAWIVALSTATDPQAWLASPASAPPLFKSLVGLAVAIGPDLELAAQALPFAWGALAVALTGWLAFRITANAVVALAAAAFVASDPVFLAQMARVKPYTLDVAVAAAIGLVFHGVLEDASVRRAWLFSGACAIGLSLSSLALFTVAPATAVLGVTLWRRGTLGVLGAHAWGAGAVIALVIAACAGLALLTPGIDQLRGHWSENYLASIADSPARLLRALGRWADSWAGRLMHANRVDTGPLPGARVAGLALVLLGTAHLFRRGLGTHVVVGALAVLSLWVASALGRIPLGVQRIETFLLPYGAVALASAAGWSEAVRHRGLALSLAAVLPILLAIQLPTARRPGYPIEESAPVVARLVRELTPDDGVWSNMLGLWALRVYGPWPSRFERNQRLGVPHPVPAIAHFSIMDLEDETAGGDPPTTRRVFVFVCHVGPELLYAAVDRLRAAGYTPRASIHRRLCSLELMTREQEKQALHARFPARRARSLGDARASPRSW